MSSERRTDNTKREQKIVYGCLISSLGFVIILFLPFFIGIFLPKINNLGGLCNNKLLIFASENAYREPKISLYTSYRERVPKGYRSDSVKIPLENVGIYEGDRNVVLDYKSSAMPFRLLIKDSRGYSRNFSGSCRYNIFTRNVSLKFER